MTPYLPIDASDPVECLTDGCYQARFYLTRATADVYLGHVDVYEGTVHKCRMAVAGTPGHQATVAALKKGAKRWIRARRRNEPAGATGFDALPAELHSKSAKRAQRTRSGAPAPARATATLDSSRHRKATSTIA